MTISPKIVPHLWYDREAREAAEFYCSVFPGSRVTSTTVLRDTPSGECEIVEFELGGQPFIAISAGPMFRFNEAISLLVRCADQQEIDYYWERLSAVPEAEACGWLKDRYGLSWQIVPVAFEEAMRSGDAEKIARLTRAFLPMKKFDLAALEAAAEGRA